MSNPTIELLKAKIKELRIYEANHLRAVENYRVYQEIAQRHADGYSAKICSYEKTLRLLEAVEAVEAIEGV